MLLLVSKESIQKVASRLCDEVVIKNIEIEERGRNEEYTWHFSKGEIAHLKLFKISNCSVHNVLSLGERVETWFIKRPGASIWRLTTWRKSEEQKTKNGRQKLCSRTHYEREQKKGKKGDKKGNHGYWIYKICFEVFKNLSHFSLFAFHEIFKYFKTIVLNLTWNLNLIWTLHETLRKKMSRPLGWSRVYRLAAALRNAKQNTPEHAVMWEGSIQIPWYLRI